MLDTNWTHLFVLMLVGLGAITAPTCSRPVVMNVQSTSPSGLLDDFESIEGWQAFPSEGAKANIASGEGTTGRALMLEFDLSAPNGYAAVRKDFDINLPPNYQFKFDLRAEAPVNNFEFKILDGLGNVWWIKQREISYAKHWTNRRISERQLTFAWGPNRGVDIRQVKSIEFVVSSGSGGKGRVFFDNLRFESIDLNVVRTARATIMTSANKMGIQPAHNEQGTVVRQWKCAGNGDTEWLAIDFGYDREFGGLVIDWEAEDFAREYDLLFSADGRNWVKGTSVVNGNGGRDYIFLPEQQSRWLKLSARTSATGGRLGLARLEVKGPEFGSNVNAFFEAVASDHPPGMYPKYLNRAQSYWTVVGCPNDVSEALMNDTGGVEVDQTGFTIEPFLFVDGTLVTWANAALYQSLEKNFLPIPSVEWRCGDLTLRITAIAAESEGTDSQLLLTYKVATSRPTRGKLFLAVRPFQVNPPWQNMLHPGGWSRIDRVTMANGVVTVNDREIIPLDAPSGFGATAFDSGEITEHLRRGHLPADVTAHDAMGFGSAAFAYDFDLVSGGTTEIHLAVPFHGWNGYPSPNMSLEGAQSYIDRAHRVTRQRWESTLDRFDLTLPASAQQVIDAVKSNLAYILINRDGAPIQPGSRNYERSWIRDGSLTCTALLELGLTDEARTYADWYAQFQFPNGKIPCVVDSRGGDPTDEHDSHGEMIYLIMQVYHFTHDLEWLRLKWDTVQRAVRFVQSLRDMRKTEVYRRGTPEQRSCFGLVPESISHEGYSSKAVRSYWDNFFVLRGLKDATTIAGILGEREKEAEFAAERDDCAKDLFASIRAVMQYKNIDFIPGCVELGDFDANATTIALSPLNELGRIPQPQLHNTFDRYFSHFTKRRDGELEWNELTPYENRVIGSFVYIGQKARAHAVLNFFMSLRRPLGWNHWAEVVYRDPQSPRFIGDMPHTWCGSDFIRSVRAMFVYEREQDSSLVVGAGIRDEWVTDPLGVEVSDLPTHYGNIDFTIKSAAGFGGGAARMVVMKVGGEVSIPPGGIVLKSPLSQRISSIEGDGRMVPSDMSEIRIERLPATVWISY